MRRMDYLQQVWWEDQELLQTNGSEGGVSVSERDVGRSAREWQNAVLLTDLEFRTLCGIHDEGTFAAQCGIWCHMKKKRCWSRQTCKGNGPDAIAKSKWHSEDKRALLQTEEECEGVGNVKSKMRIFNVKYEEDRCGELRILIEEEQRGKELFYQGEFVVQYGSKHDVGRGFIREVAGGTQHDWHRLCWHNQVKLQEFVEPRKDQVRNVLTL